MGGENVETSNWSGAGFAPVFKRNRTDHALRTFFVFKLGAILMASRETLEVVRQARFSGDTETLSRLGKKGARARQFQGPPVVPKYLSIKKELFQRAVAKELKAQ